MCLAIYLASDKQLNLVPWNEKQPKFNVISISSREGKVKKQFKYTNVVYIGSHEGCGCGFFKEGEIGEELKQIQANYDALAYYLTSQQFKGAQFEMFSCWEGDQGTVPEFNEKLSLKELVSLEFEFKEKAYYEIV